MKILQFIDKTISTVVNSAMVLLFLVMTGLAVIQVFLRYFFNGSLLWGDVAARNLVIWVGFLGAAIATRQNKHFRIDILSRFIPKRYYRWLLSFANLFTAVVCYYLGQASMTFLSLDADNKTFLNIPINFVEVIIPISFFIMMVQFALRIFIPSTEPTEPPPTFPQEA